ncbi:MAG TPA: MazG nucleotide pyrophosphohydrolase domain-containing protein [Candidatus Acidoferrum sp.]|nr:MazG nucleotide pyrophosphohydrolase domain-containing protein [Candidatus Acidoferrum sp.]
MDLKEIQDELKSRYGLLDEASGAIFLLSVLTEECGELASAIRRNKDNAGEEVADVIFCALSLGNVIGADIDSLIVSKYLKRDFEDVTKTWNDLPQ